MNARPEFQTLDEIEQALQGFEKSISKVEILNDKELTTKELVALSKIRLAIEQGQKAIEEALQAVQEKENTVAIKSNPAITAAQLDRKPTQSQSFTEKLKHTSALLEKNLGAMTEKVGLFVENLADTQDATARRKAEFKKQKSISEKQKSIETETKNLEMLKRLEQIELKVYSIQKKISDMLDSLNSKDLDKKEKAYRDLLKMQSYLNEEGILSKRLADEREKINSEIDEHEVVAAYAWLDKLNDSSESPENRTNAYEKLNELKRKWARKNLAEHLQDDKETILKAIENHEINLRDQGPSLSKDEMTRHQADDLAKKEAAVRAEQEKNARLQKIREDMEKLRAKADAAEKQAQEAEQKAKVEENKIFQKIEAEKEAERVHEETEREKFERAKTSTDEKFMSRTASLSRALEKGDVILSFLNTADQQIDHIARIGEQDSVKFINALTEAKELDDDFKNQLREIRSILKDQNRIITPEHKGFLIQKFNEYHSQIQNLQEKINAAKGKQQEIHLLLKQKKKSILELKAKIDNEWYFPEERDQAFKILEFYTSALKEMGADPNKEHMQALQSSLEHYKNRDVTAESNRIADSAVRSLREVTEFMQIIEGSINDPEYMVLKEHQIKNTSLNLNPPILYQIALCKKHLNKMIKKDDTASEACKMKEEALSLDIKAFKSIFKTLFDKDAIIQTLLKDLKSANLSIRMDAAVKISRVKNLIKLIDGLSTEVHSFNLELDTALSDFENNLLTDLNKKITNLDKVLQENKNNADSQNQRKLALGQYIEYQESLRSLLEENGISEHLKTKLAELDRKLTDSIETANVLIKLDTALEQGKEEEKREAIKFTNETELLNVLNETLTLQAEKWGHHVINGVTVIIDDGTKSGKRITVPDGIGEMIRTLNGLPSPTGNSRTDFFRKAPVDLRQAAPVNQPAIIKNLGKIQKLAENRKKWKLTRSKEAEALYTVLAENLKSRNLATPMGLARAIHNIKIHNASLANSPPTKGKKTEGKSK